MSEDSAAGHSNDRALRSIVLRATGSGYDDFCDDVEDTVFGVYLLLQDDRHLYCSMSEDQITGVIKSHLKHIGFDATIGQVVGGATDLLVKQSRDEVDYKWIAEAKLYDGPAYLHEGFLQLTTRYLNPQAGVNYRGALLIYRQTTELPMPDLVESWRERLPGFSKEKGPEVNANGCSALQPKTNAFYSEHQCPRTGTIVKVTHLPLDVLHNPEDKSARSRKGSG